MLVLQLAEHIKAWSIGFGVQLHGFTTEEDNAYLASEFKNNEK